MNSKYNGNPGPRNSNSLLGELKGNNSFFFKISRTRFIIVKVPLEDHNNRNNPSVVDFLGLTSLLLPLF